MIEEEYHKDDAFLSNAHAAGIVIETTISVDIPG
jgi:hypothetical protein